VLQVLDFPTQKLADLVIDGTSSVAGRNGVMCLFVTRGVKNKMDRDFIICIA
jgi:hypothetical protein